MNTSDLSIWINGHVVTAGEARISPLDHGFLVGDGVFETLVARNGKPFTAVRHWHRLTHSCDAMGIAAPSFETFIAAIADVMDANGLCDARVRVTVTSGDGPLGSDRGDSPPTVTVVATPLKKWPPTETAVTVEWTRNERGGLAGIKSTSYGENARALAAAKARGAGEALLANTRGELCEGTGTNIFIMAGGIVKTPPLSSGCLAGVTRGLVIEACVKAGIAVEETVLPLSVLETCEEAFLTSSTRDVHPLAMIDGREMPGENGLLTRSVARAFCDYIAGRDDP
ncbi:MAG: aminotransferase class IV [Verrucomicrobiaceae bacterium]|nr:aminotransferase class IV [Verrucomicrobiaceae bacterium]